MVDPLDFFDVLGHWSYGKSSKLRVHAHLDLGVWMFVRVLAEDSGQDACESLKVTIADTQGFVCWVPHTAVLVVGFHRRCPNPVSVQEDFVANVHAVLKKMIDKDVGGAVSRDGYLDKKGW